MVEGIKFEVVTPYKLVVSELVRSVVAPGVLGEFGILPGHTPFLTTLKIGSIRFIDMEGKEKLVFINGGFAEALSDRVTVLADSAERREDIDIQRAKNSMNRAKKRLSDVGNLNFNDSNKEVDYHRARNSLNRAIKRIDLVESG